MNLTGKRAIVTGGGRDIGRAVAIRLAQAGADVAINYYSSDTGATSAVSEITAMGRKAFAMQGDLTKEADAQALVAATIEQLGGVDIMVHVSGGLLGRVKITEMTAEHFQNVMELNLHSLFYMAKASAPHMPAGSAIITLASQAARDGGGGGAAAYAASKGAVLTLTRGLAKELAPNIRVNGLCPGMIDTDFHNTFTTPEVRKNVANATPLKREGTSEDCANLVAFLASDQSAFMTGACIDINGGLLFS